MPKTRKTAEILSEQDAVVQMPSRRYPAIAVQGDTLGGWQLRIARIVSLARETGNAELISACEAIQRQINVHFEVYNRVCREQNRGGL